MQSVWQLTGPVVGCDPGATGAIAYLHPRERLLLLWDMPTARRGARARVCPLGLRAIRAAMDRLPAPVSVVIEDVAAMPDQGVSSMFSFGYAAGAAEAALAGLSGAAPVLVQPRAWKGRLGLGADKSAAVATAEAWLAGYASAFRGPRGGGLDGRAEAALLAVYGALSSGVCP